MQSSMEPPTADAGTYPYTHRLWVGRDLENAMIRCLAHVEMTNKGG